MRISGAEAKIISIHSPLAGRDVLPDVYELVHDISIHSPLAGRDNLEPVHLHARKHFNPLAPRGARRPLLTLSGSSCIFQSTRPSRGETMYPGDSSAPGKISIHSPLAGRDPLLQDVEPEGSLFQSTRPSRGETRAGSVMLPAGKISIHSPLAGRDKRHYRQSRNI